MHFDDRCSVSSMVGERHMVESKAINAAKYGGTPATAHMESNITADSASEIFEDAFDSDSSFGDAVDKPTMLDNENHSQQHDDYASQVEALAVSMAPGKHRPMMDNDQKKTSMRDGIAHNGGPAIMHVIQQETDQEIDPSSPETSRHHGQQYQSDGGNEVLFDAHYSESSRSTRSTSLTDDSNYNRLPGGGGCMDVVMPSIEQSYRESFAIHDQSFEATSGGSTDDFYRAAHSSEFEHSIEDPIDLDIFRDNAITVIHVNPKHIAVNKLNPREQEEADESMREGMRNLFDNNFMKAKGIFQSKASFEPLFSLGLGAMAFIKAMMTYQEEDIKTAMNALSTSYTIAKAQIDNAYFKQPIKATLSHYFSSFLYGKSKSGLPAGPGPESQMDEHGCVPEFIPNGILRAHVIKAESCLLMGILQLSQETVMNYIKCGLNLRRAYNSYCLVWREYKRMGQKYTKYMDRDTVSAIQFGIGAVNLLLSSMPSKITKLCSSLGWQGDKQLGIALLRLCIEERGIRAPLASLVLLSYYSILTSFAPQIYTKDQMSSAIECLLEAQRNYPSSCFFLFFAARIARVARNIPLSTQSFSFSAEACHGEWAETAMRQVADYETGFNLALQLDWEGAAKCFEQLSREHYWSSGFCLYFAGTCKEMLGKRTDCILAMADVSDRLAKQQPTSSKSYIDNYVEKKVAFFQKTGYQDMSLSLPALEILLVWNAFVQMQPSALETCLDQVQRTLELIYQREKNEYDIRIHELVPSIQPPDYYKQRAVLLLIKASILNALERHTETIPHLNWIMDHRDRIKEESWIIPFTYWEAGVTSWGLGNVPKSRKMWQQALSFTKYDFEYRMAIRLSLALMRCDELDADEYVESRETKGLSTQIRKRMPIVIEH